MARQKTTDSTTHNYAAHFQQEGRGWIESYHAQNMAAAALMAKVTAHNRAYELVTALPLNPED